MTSEKMRYRNRNRGPSAPLGWAEAKAQLRNFDHDRLCNLLWMRAERDPILWQSLMASVAIQVAKGDWEKTKQAVDYALHIPDYVRYTDGHYGVILHEMINTLEILKNQVGVEFSIQTAEYIFECGDELIENFEDGWDWVSALDELEKWIAKNK